MRRCVIVSIAILIFIALVGGACEGCNAGIERRYGDGLRLLGAALGERKWREARLDAERIAARWEKEMPWIQLWVNHAETDAVTHALRALQSSIGEEDRLSAMLYYDECVENFAHLRHRDAFTLKNIL